MRSSRWLPGLLAIATLCVSCTERRRATEPVPTGDTVEVVISKEQPQETLYDVIEVEDASDPLE